MSDYALAAGELLRCGLGRSLRPLSAQPEYEQLISDFALDAQFAAAVRDVATGLGLEILACDHQVGLVLGAVDASPFAARPEDYSPSDAKSVQGRITHGVVLLAITALCFPQPADLDDPTHATRFTVAEVGEYLTALSDAINDADPEHNFDPPAGRPLEGHVFRQWIEGFEHGHTRDGRRHLRASDSIITRASQWLCNQKLLREVMPGTYETRPRFRIHARDTAAKLSASLHAQAQITDEDVDRAALEAEA